MGNFKFNNKSNGKNDKYDDKNDKGNCKPNIWDCNNGYYGRPYCAPVIIEKSHKFEGNKFPVGLTEGKAISGAAVAALGIKDSNNDVTANTKVSGKITFESADFHNSLGAYTITKNGTIQAATMIVKDIDGSGATFNLDTGANAKEIGFFLIGEGATRNNNYDGLDFSTGTLKFITNYGTPGATATKVTDAGASVSLIFTSEGGVDTKLDGFIWHTTERGGSNSLNVDGMVHTLSGVDGKDCKTLKIAFEDVDAPVSDKDYNDAIFTVQMTDLVEVCKPVCVPQPPKCDYRDIIEYCDPVSKAINCFVNNVAGKFGDGNTSGNKADVGHVVAAALASNGHAPDDQAAQHAAQNA